MIKNGLSKCIMTDVYGNCVRAGVTCEEDICYFKGNSDVAHNKKGGGMFSGSNL